MIRLGDTCEADELREGLTRFEEEYEPLLGLNEQSREVFVAQLIESLRRVRYRNTLRNTKYRFDLDSPNGYFDPLKGAIFSNRFGNFDEACWLVFLAVQFGRHRQHGWALSGAFYTRLAEGGRWTWLEVSGDPDAVLDWLEAHEIELRSLGAKFGNHRKYESLKARSNRGTGAAITSYVDWVGDSHFARFSSTGSPAERFAESYKSLDRVAGFGRVARFDYLTLLRDLGLVDLEADSMHLSESTGPVKGARLLLVGSVNSGIKPREVETRLRPMRDLLGISFDVLEDALCNWQKSPEVFKPFRG